MDSGIFPIRLVSLHLYILQWALWVLPTANILMGDFSSIKFSISVLFSLCFNGMLIEQMDIVQ